MSVSQTAIPFFLMRGGSSRGPYFHRADLPQEKDKLEQALLAVIGSGHPLNIDGIGGGNAVTTKVAMLSPSTVAGCDIDYFFAQVSVEDKKVDFKPTCGNILSAVGPAAIEMGLATAQENETQITIHAVNTGAKVLAVIRTSATEVIYQGKQAIDGVPGTAAPVFLHFMDIVGSATGKLLPTGNLRDSIDGIDVTCMDVAMPMVIAKAEDFALSGYESAQELNDNSRLLARIETIRRQAGEKMNMGDVSQSVIPKFALLAKAQQGGTLAARYFMPWKTHPSMAVTGSQCIASCALVAGTIADGIVPRMQHSPVTVTIEHPMGSMDVIVDWQEKNGFHITSAGIVRTARKIAQGNVFIPTT